MRLVHALCAFGSGTCHEVHVEVAKTFMEVGHEVG